MKPDERIALVCKTARWLEHTDRSVRSVGGYGVETILSGISDELLYTMIANDLYITPKRKRGF